ncbi:MAG: hypothetical protein IJ274_16100 [Lachnospiraceae bacterium]|nr:hypothetical protein [Lachnospiraceae bacterium]
MVAGMLKSKEKLFRRLCKEPKLYFVAYKILGNEEKAEEVYGTVLERMISVYPVLKRKSYDDLVYICRTVILYLCVTSMSLDLDDVKKDSIRSEEDFLALVRDCDSEVLLQAIKEMPKDKRCILTLQYVFGLDTHVMNTLLGLSHHELLQELESSKRVLITKMENLYECQKSS